MRANLALFLGVFAFVALMSFSAVVYAISLSPNQATTKQKSNFCTMLETKELLETSGLVLTEHGWFSGEFGRIIAPTTKDAVALGFARPCGGFEVT